MSYKDNGFLMVRPGVLAFIEVRDEETREVIYEPTDRDILDICERYKFDHVKTVELLRNVDKHVYGAIFDATTYRNS